MPKQGEALDLTGAQQQAEVEGAQRAEQMRELARLIDEAGELNAAKGAAERDYDRKRAQIDALMQQMDLQLGEGEVFKATRKSRREKFIDVAKLLASVGKKRAYACLNVVMKNAEAHLTPKQLEDLLGYRDGAPVLTIKRKGE